jgi:hypothetical protein
MRAHGLTASSATAAGGMARLRAVPREVTWRRRWTPRAAILASCSSWGVWEGEDGEEEEGEGVTIRELLLRTGEREIVEASPMDRIWGIGFGAAKAGSVRHRWGLNLLGKALMVVRAELREGDEAKEDGNGEEEKKA